MKEGSLKYAAFVVAIKDDVIYTSAMLVALGEMRGLHRSLEGDDLEIQRIRVWKTLRAHALRKLGQHDGLVATDVRSTPSKGWCGYRWKRILDQESWVLGIQQLKDLGTLHLELPDAEVRVSRSGWQASLANGPRRERPVYAPEEEIQAMRRQRATEQAERLAKVKARGQAIVDICQRSAAKRGKKRN